VSMGAAPGGVGAGLGPAVHAGLERAGGALARQFGVG
jgi:hypothetical protein